MTLEGWKDERGIIIIGTACTIQYRVETRGTFLFCLPAKDTLCVIYVKYEYSLLVSMNMIRVPAA